MCARYFVVPSKQICVRFTINLRKVQWKLVFKLRKLGKHVNLWKTWFNLLIYLGKLGENCFDLVCRSQSVNSLLGKFFLRYYRECLPKGHWILRGAFGFLTGVSDSNLLNSLKICSPWEYILRILRHNSSALLKFTLKLT